MIPIFSPSVGEEELNEIRKVFASSWLGKGGQEAHFKRSLANRLGVGEEHLCLSSTCTELIFAFVHLFVPHDKIILVPTISFPAIGSAIIENNVPYKLLDVDEFGNVDLAAVELAVRAGRVGAIFVTHYGSGAVDIPKLRQIVGEEVVILEDSACALGGSVNGKAIGTCGDFACWSFDAMKLITVGDGGMGYCRKAEHAQMLREYLYLGLPEKEKSGLDKSKDGAGWWEYSLTLPGRRAILNDISAAIGNVQLTKIDAFLQARRKNIRELDTALRGVGDLRIMMDVDPESSGYYFTISTSRRDDLAVFLRDNGVYTTFRYWPLHKMTMFESESEFPRADWMAQTFLNLPCHNKLTEAELDKIITTIKRFFA
jgi:dTDP-4-amino-4,6-dideoxygalactose transaminase